MMYWTTQNFEGSTQINTFHIMESPSYIFDNPDYDYIRIIFKFCFDLLNSHFASFLAQANMVWLTTLS